MEMTEKEKISKQKLLNLKVRGKNWGKEKNRTLRARRTISNCLIDVYLEFQKERRKRVEHKKLFREKVDT